MSTCIWVFLFTDQGTSSIGNAVFIIFQFQVWDERVRSLLTRKQNNWECVWYTIERGKEIIKQSVHWDMYILLGFCLIDIWFILETRYKID